MGAGGRSAAWAVMLGLCVACGPKAAPAPAGVAPATPESLDGTWWLTDGHDGPVRARVEFDGREMEVSPVGAAGRMAFSLHKEGREWEAIGDRGLVVRLDPMSADGLLMYRSDGQVGMVLRAVPLPAAFGGGWVSQDPATGEVASVRFIGGPQGGPGTMTVKDGQSAKVWGIPRAGGGWMLVLQSGKQVGLTDTHEFPDGSWLLLGDDRKPRVLYRAGQRPRWVGPPKD